MERIGIYGGTYSPPHVGHLRAAEYAIEALQLDRLLLIPTGVSPHKEMSAGASSADRLEMLRLSAAGIEKAEVSVIEIRRSGSSYTVDTLRQLKSENSGAELVLLMGTDMSCASIPGGSRRPSPHLRHWRYSAGAQRARRRSCRLRSRRWKPWAQRWNWWKIPSTPFPPRICGGCCFSAAPIPS